MDGAAYPSSIAQQTRSFQPINISTTPLKQLSGPTMLLFAGLGLAATPATTLDSAIKVSFIGFLHVSDACMDDVVLAVDMNGVSQQVAISKTGRFIMDMPDNTEAVLHFEKPGHVAKDVTVDTHYAGMGWPGQGNRQVKFAVILHPERAMAGLQYPGPVGSIGFDPDNGSLTATHDLTVVPARRKGTMEF